ncbi:MAG: glycosyltransferase family 9 protein [Candidatus Omnitrophica bacterium]|nr:glycosyltransferase family 9 protein [Candidatus Omnitrophota bacterium]
MKRIDRYFGLPICWFLYIYDKFINLFYRRKISRFEEIKKIVFLKWFGLGTILKLSPLLEAVRLNLPNAKIIFYTFSENKQILKILNFCDEVRVIDNSYITKFIKDFFQHIFKFRLIKPDLVVDLEFFSNFSTIFAFLSGSSQRIGFDSNYFWYKNLSNKKVDLYKYHSLKEIYLEIAKIMGLEINKFTFKKINIDPVKKQHLEIFLRKYNVDCDKSLIGINVNTSEVLLLRRWPAEYFVSLINILSKNLDYKKWKIILIGSVLEKNYIIKNILNKVKFKDHIVNLAGVLDLEDLIILIDKFKIFISNDSGPLYIAMVQDIPTVSFWGPTSPFFHLPIDDPKHKYFYTDIDCNFCFDKSMHKPRIVCKGKASCMLGIEPKEVADYILKFLKS